MDITDIHRKVELNDFTADEKLTFQALMDPVIWAEATLRDPDSPNRYLTLRKYQVDSLKCQAEEKINEKGDTVLTNRIKLYRWGRRTGKKVLLAVETLHKACINHNFKILYVAPFESQCGIYFGMLERLLVNSAIVPIRFVRKPFSCQFKNGSTITAHTANVRSTRKGSTIRGAEGDFIIIDEMDYGIDEVINEVLMPIFMGNNRSTILAASTPTGRRGLFYTWSKEGKDMGITEFHFPSYISPKWDTETEKIAKKSMTRDQYIHEIDAEFGEAAEGVFKHKDLDAMLKNYTYNAIQFDKVNNQYIMGIDWNETFGTCIVILEKNKKTGKYRVFKNEIVPKQEFTQLEGLNKIIALHQQYPCDFIYADHGFGSTQIELLKKYGLENTATRFTQILKDIDYGGVIEVRDPATGNIEKKPAKPFLVDNAVIFSEGKVIDIPEDEDTEYGLIGQMRNFRVTKYSKTGHPMYEGKLRGEDNDHTLNAFMLALAGFTLEFSYLTQYDTTTTISHIKNIFKGAVEHRENVEDSNISNFKNLLRRVTPNYTEQKQYRVNKKTEFIPTTNNTGRILQINLKRKAGVNRENI